MPKVRFDVSAQDPEKSVGRSFDSPKPGGYALRIKEFNPGFAKGDGGRPDKERPQFEIIFEVFDADKESNKKFAKSAARLWYYIPHPSNLSYENQLWKVDQFLQAIGLADKKKRKVVLDSESMEGIEVVGVVRAGKNLNNEYRGEIGSLMPYDEDTFGQGSEDDDEDVGAAEAEDDAWDDDGDELSKKRSSKKKAPADEEEEEEDEDDDGYDDMNVAELRKDAKDRDLTSTGTKATLIKRLRANDKEDADSEGDEEEEEEEKPAAKRKTSAKAKEDEGDDDEFPWN